MAKSKITPAYKQLSSLNLGKDFLRQYKLTPGKQYPILVAGLKDQELSGTLQKSGVIGGLAAMYTRYPQLAPENEVDIDFDGTTIIITPPGAPTEAAKAKPAVQGDAYVLDRKNARRVYIAPYAPGSLNTWEPKGKPDVYMVFGRLAEYTDFRYCCASSQEILDKLGIEVKPKPDVVLIEEGTDRYLVAEFEVLASDFIAHEHKKDDFDVLVCWQDDVPLDKKNQLPKVLCLKDLISQLLETGEIEL